MKVGPSLLEHAMSPETLNQAWRLIKSEHTPWAPTVNREQLQQHLVGYILKAREEVLHDRYRPEPLRQFPLAKSNGKTRIISAQHLKDKLIQRAILITLEPASEQLFHHDSYGYRKGRNVQMAVQKATERIKIGQHWLVDADISSFFDQIPIPELKKVIKGFIKDTPLNQLINKWLDQGAHHGSLLSKPRGISQGSILSPLFCNLYLHSFDMAMSKANIPFVRYADDFLLFSSTESKAQSAKTYAEKTLKNLGLELHPKKTQIVKSNRQTEFLGQRLPDSPKI